MLRSTARSALPWVAGLFAGCAIVQVFLAGLGVFDGPRNFITHRDFGYAFSVLTLVVLVLAVTSRAPRRITGLSVLLLVQFLMQSVFIAVRGDLPQVAALHPVNGFLILIVSLVITREAWRIRRVAPVPAKAPATALGSPPEATPAGARASAR